MQYAAAKAAAEAARVDRDAAELEVQELQGAAEAARLQIVQARHQGNYRSPFRIPPGATTGTI